MSRPGCCLSLATSSVTLPLIRVELHQSACFKVVETTYLRKLFMIAASGPVPVAKADANPWYVARPSSKRVAGLHSGLDKRADIIIPVGHGPASKLKIISGAGAFHDAIQRHVK